jgi:hypothetical protein
MKQRKTFLLTRAMAAAMAATLILACSSKSSTPSPGSVTDPPGTIAVTTAPYPVCTTLEEGSFVTSSGGSYTVPGADACTPAGTPATGPADMHCVGVPPQPVNGADCSATEAGAAATSDAADEDAAAADSGSAGEDAGSAPTPGPCDENGTDGAYGSTMFGTEGDDDDCKYHVTYAPFCGSGGTYFVVTAVYLTRDGVDGGPAPLTGASTFAEICLSDTHPGPNNDNRPPTGIQDVVEGPPGTYTVGPVVFDESGTWTVRFHFNEFCCDVTADSPHGHAAFFLNVTVP